MKTSLLVILVMIGLASGVTSVRLMKAAKSEDGLSRGRMRNSDSGHKCWMQTLNHFVDINQHMEEGVNKHCPLHKDLAKTRMKS